MSIQSEINRIKKGVSDIYGALEDKGIPVPASGKLDDLPQAIEDADIGPGGESGVNAELVAYIERSQNTISDTVLTKLGAYSAYQSSFTSVNFTSVEEIGAHCFDNSTSLMSAVFPKLTTVGEYAFNNCSSLSTVRFSKLQTTGAYMFAGANVESVTEDNFPSLTTIGNYSFSGNTALQTVNSTKITTVEQSGFAGSYVQNVILPNLTTVKSSGFENAYLNGTLDFTGLETVQYNGFYNTRLTGSQTFPKVASVDSYSFAYNQYLTELTLSILTQTSTGSYDFYYNTILTAYHFPLLTTIQSDYCFQANYALKTFDAPELTTISRSYVFADCNTMESIELNKLSSMSGNYNFQNCTYLTNVNFPLLTTIPNYTFTGNTALNNVSIPSVTTINNNGFYNCRSLNKIQLPATLTNIGQAAFRNCAGLQKIWIPKECVTITASSSSASYRPFNYARNLEIYTDADSKQSGWGTYWNYLTSSMQATVHYSSTLNDYNAQPVINCMFPTCANNTNSKLTIDNGVISGFSLNQYNYLQLHQKYMQKNNTTFVMKFKLNTQATATQQTIFDGNYFLKLYVGTDKKLYTYEWYEGINVPLMSGALEADKWYWVKVKFDSANKSKHFYMSEDGEHFTYFDSVYDPSSFDNNDTNCRIGTDRDGSNYYFDGYFDFNNWFILKSDDTVLWSGIYDFTAPTMSDIDRTPIQLDYLYGDYSNYYLTTNTNSWQQVDMYRFKYDVAHDIYFLDNIDLPQGNFLIGGMGGYTNYYPPYNQWNYLSYSYNLYNNNVHIRRILFNPTLRKAKIITSDYIEPTYPDVTLTIVPSEQDALVKFTVGGVETIASSITVKAYDEVTYSVSKSGYLTVTDTIPVYADTTLPIEMEQGKESTDCAIDDDTLMLFHFDKDLVDSSKYFSSLNPYNNQYDYYPTPTLSTTSKFGDKSFQRSTSSYPNFYNAIAYAKAADKFTIDYWVYLSSDYQTSCAYPYIWLDNNAQLCLFVHKYQNGIDAEYLNNGSWVTANSAFTPTQYNTWNHVAWEVELGNKITYYFNGHKVIEQDISGWTSNTNKISYMQLSYGTWSSSTYSYLDELRLSKGLRYQMSFALPTMAYYEEDPYEIKTYNGSPCDLYLEGTVNGWNPVSQYQFKYDSTAGVYYLDDVEWVGEYKFVSSDWSYNWGGNSSWTNLPLDTNVKLTRASNNLNTTEPIYAKRIILSPNSGIVRVITGEKPPEESGESGSGIESGSGVESGSGIVPRDYWSVGQPSFVMNFDPITQQDAFTYYTVDNTQISASVSAVAPVVNTTGGPNNYGCLAPTYDSTTPSNRRYVKINIPYSVMTGSNFFIEFFAKLQNNGSDSEIYQSFLSNMESADSKYYGWFFRWAQANSSYGALDYGVSNSKNSLTHSWTNIGNGAGNNTEAQNWWQSNTASNVWAHYALYFDFTNTHLYFFNNGYVYCGAPSALCTNLLRIGSQRDNIFIGNAKYGTGYTLSPMGAVRILQGTNADNYVNVITNNFNRTTSATAIYQYTVPTGLFYPSGLYEYVATTEIV